MENTLHSHIRPLNQPCQLCKGLQKPCQKLYGGDCPQLKPGLSYSLGLVPCGFSFYRHHRYWGQRDFDSCKTFLYTAPLVFFSIYQFFVCARRPPSDAMRSHPNQQRRGNFCWVTRRRSEYHQKLMGEDEQTHSLQILITFVRSFDTSTCHVSIPSAVNTFQFLSAIIGRPLKFQLFIIIAIIFPIQFTIFVIYPILKQIHLFSALAVNSVNKSSLSGFLTTDFKFLNDKI